MQVMMNDNEILFFRSFLNAATNYLEFGAGGSTVLAASICERVVAVDSAQVWLDRVSAACRQKETAARLTLVHIDLGPIRDGGYPTDETTKYRWADYHSSIWASHDVAGSDLCLVDGRFRVACAAQAALNLANGAVVLMHDYPTRPHYHAVERFMRPIAKIDEIAAFLVDSERRSIARQVLDERTLETG